MLNTSTDKKGISREEYQKRQSDLEQVQFTAETNRRLQQIELSISDLKNALNGQQAFNGSLQSSCASEINEISMHMDSSLKEFRQSLGDLGTLFSAQEKNIQSIVSFVNELVAKQYLEDKIHVIRLSCEEIFSSYKKLHEEVHGLIDRQKQEFVNQLKDLKEELISRPTGLPELHKLLDSKIELVELNGQNAVLRSCNNEKHLMLVDRKIDNIYQLIKKFELQQGTT